MLKSIIATRHSAPARPGQGVDPITEPAALEAYRAVLARHPIVARAPSAQVRQLLLDNVRLVIYRAGFAVMSAGEVGDRLGLVLAGRCQVVEPADPLSGLPAKRVGWVGHDELLGEMSLLSDSPRRHTVVACRDTVVAEVPFESFDRLADPLHRLALRGWLGEVAARRFAADGAPRPRDITLTLLPLAPDVGDAFAERLAETLRAMGDDCAIVRRADFERLPTALELSRIERRHTYVVYLASGADRAWDALIVRQGDRLLLVADGAGPEKLHRFDLMARDALATRTLVLLHPAGRAIGGTARWLDLRPGAFHVHVRDGVDGDLQRCARLVTGRGRGVIFAGASSQGVGYAGCARAFEELGFVPDVVAGNSSGALPAALLAAGHPAARIVELALEAVAAFKPSLRQTALPVVALSDGTGVSEFLQRALGDVAVEDLAVPFLATAVDLSAMARRDMRRGPLWLAVRASVSLPIIYPPVIDDGVLVDGGALENYPVDQIAPLCEQGQILICDLSQEIPPMTDIAQYGATVGGLKALARRLKPFGKRGSYPLLGDVVFRVMCLASAVHYRNLLARCEPHWTFIRPTVDSPGLFGVTRAQTLALIEACRAHTRSMLDDMPELHGAGRAPSEQR